MGKLQSPFFGRYETIDPDRPILYPRWRVSSKAETSQQINGTEIPKNSSKRRREDEAAAEQHGTVRDQEAGPAPSRIGKDSSREETKSKKGKRSAEKAPEQPRATNSGPGNAEEAQQMRQQLGYNDAPAVQAQPAGFSFGFNVDANAAAAASVSNGNADAQPADELPSAKKQKRSKTDKQSQDQQVPHAGPHANGTTPGQEQAAASPQGVPRRVFVGGMPFSMEEDDVRAFWEECGPIESLDLMRFPDTQRFRGIAFITFCQEEGYQAALQCTGEQVQGQFLRVEPCQSAGAKKPAGPKASQSPAAQQPGKGARSQAAPKTAGYNVAYVGNLPFDATVQQLKEAFQGCAVTRVRLHTDRVSGQSKGFAHVHFADEASLDRAVGLDGLDLQGRKMKIGYAQPKK